MGFDNPFGAAVSRGWRDTATVTPAFLDLGSSRILRSVEW